MYQSLLLVDIYLSIYLSIYGGRVLISCVLDKPTFNPAKSQYMIDIWPESHLVDLNYATHKLWGKWKEKHN